MYSVKLRDGTVIQDELWPGDYVLTPFSNPIMRPAEAWLGWLEPGWKDLAWKPWHMAFVIYPGVRAEFITGRAHCIQLPPIVCDAWWPKVRQVELRKFQEYRIYRWFDKPLPVDDLAPFLIGDKVHKARLGAYYDLACYPWTFLYHMTGGNLPRIYNRLYTCWELAADLALWFGDPWCDMMDYPLITDFLRAMGEITEPPRIELPLVVDDGIPELTFNSRYA